MIVSGEGMTPSELDQYITKHCHGPDGILNRDLMRLAIEFYGKDLTGEERWFLACRLIYQPSQDIRLKLPPIHEYLRV